MIDPADTESTITGVMLDVSSVRQLQEQLAQAQRLEALGLLTGGIAHDFNNILMCIYSYAELAIGEAQADHSALNALLEIRTAARRAAGLTQQLLAFSRRQIMKPIPVPTGFHSL